MSRHAAEVDTAERSGRAASSERRRFIAGVVAVLVGLVVLVFALIYLTGERPDGPRADLERVGSATTAEAEEPAVDEQAEPDGNRAADGSVGESGTRDSDDTATEGAELDEEASVAAAKEVIREYLNVADQIYAGDVAVESIAALATGRAYTEVEAAFNELSSMKWQQEGTVNVKHIDVASKDLTGDQPVIAFDVCIDISDVGIVDNGGRSVREPGAQGSRGGDLHLYEAIYEDSTWLVSAHDFPDESGC